MTKYVFQVPTGSGGAVFRICSDSGATAPATIYPRHSAVAILGSTIREGDGFAPAPTFLGPDGVQTLYAQQLNAEAKPFGSITTLAGVDVTQRPVVPASKPARLTVVASRNNTGYLGINGSSSTQTFWSKHIALCSFTGAQLLYGNSYGTAGGAQGDGPGDLAVNASMLMPNSTTPYRGVAAGGARVVTIKPGATAAIDVAAGATKGQAFFVGTYVSGNWPTGLALNAAKGVGYDTTGDPTVTTDSGEGIASPSTTDTTATGVKSSSFVVAYTPLLILGYTTDVVPCFVGIGDSILNYSDESTDMGFFTRAINNQWPNFKVSQPGETAQQWAVNGTSPALLDYRQKLIRYGTHFVFGYGRNDVSGSRTLAQLQADLITGWNQAKAFGGISWQTTTTPKATSTDQYATLANQTVTTNDAARTGKNDWLRDGAPMLAGAAAAVGSTATGTIRTPMLLGVPSTLFGASPSHPLYDYLEVADVVESSRNSGKWTVTQVRSVADGAMSTGATPKVLTSATAAFTQADAGKSVFVTGAGAAGAVVSTTIAVVTNATTVGLVGSCSTTVSGTGVQIGAATYDNVHPDGYWHRQIAAAIAPQLAAAALAYTG